MRLELFSRCRTTHPFTFSHCMYLCVHVQLYTQLCNANYDIMNLKFSPVVPTLCFADKLAYSAQKICCRMYASVCHDIQYQPGVHQQRKLCLQWDLNPQPSPYLYSVPTWNLLSTCQVHNYFRLCCGEYLPSIGC